jgi:hypothetical protein
MVLLDDVVEIPATADLDGIPIGSLRPQHAQRTVTGCVAVEIELSRPPWVMGLSGLGKELSGRTLAAICTQQRIDGFAVLVDGTVQIADPATHRHRCLVHSPGRMHAAGIARPSPLELGDIALHPTTNSRVGNDNAALGHHFHQIPVNQPIVRYHRTDNSMISG